MENAKCYERFNTSHVSINPAAGKEDYVEYKRFNTSHVSINLSGYCPVRYVWYVSIHLMFLLIRYRNDSYRYILCVSIHLMFLLIRYRPSASPRHYLVSIHLMFLLISFITI